MKITRKGFINFAGATTVILFAAWMAWVMIPGFMMENRMYTRKLHRPEVENVTHTVVSIEMLDEMVTNDGDGDVRYTDYCDGCGLRGREKIAHFKKWVWVGTTDPMSDAPVGVH